MEFISSAHSENVLPDSIKYIIASVNELDDFTPSSVRKIVLNADLKPNELMRWNLFDHSAADSYGRRLVYDGGFFEIMVMSWRPGDVSAIHDHGYTQWGAVQIFGPAEHAIFVVQNGEIRTLSRVTITPGEVVYVGHDLIHQMGNLTDDTHFLTFHLYGNEHRRKGITADARIFDLHEGSIQRTDGGVFQALPEGQIKRREPAPDPDFMTWLRNTVEVVRRVQAARSQNGIELNKTINNLSRDLFDKRRKDRLLHDIAKHTNSTGHADPHFLKLLCGELSEAARTQDAFLSKEASHDSFSTYAELYDAVIGKPCLDEFIAPYLKYCQKKYALDFQRSTLLSIGCGTGLMERYLVDNLGLQPSHLLGIDISNSMVEVAARRINAEVGDIMTLDPTVQVWDLVFGGLNVFQYLHHNHFELAIQKTAAVVKAGGQFVGDFITSDHIRWYPNIILSDNHKIISVRTPSLIEKNNYMYQSSRIISIDFRQGMRITDEGTHERFLPPLSRVRYIFEQAFAGPVQVFDAVTLEPIEKRADTCQSTRYLVCARN